MPLIVPEFICLCPIVFLLKCQWIKTKKNSPYLLLYIYFSLILGKYETGP